MKLIASVVIVIFFLSFAGCSSPAPDEVVSLSISDATGPEGSNLSFTFTLAGVFNDTLWVNYHTKNVTTSDSDYSVVNAGRVAFLPGATTATVEISAFRDAITEGNETFSVIAELGGLVVKNVATGTITDGPAPVLAGVFVAGVGLYGGMFYWNADDVVQLIPPGHTTNPYRMIVANNNIYLTASIDNKPVYYVNGVADTLHGELPFVSSNGMAVLGNDVYVAGVELDNLGVAHALIWKNGERTRLSNSDNSNATDVAIEGSDVYVTGSEDHAAVYWKNGQINYLPGNEAGVTVASFITVADGNVYISGESFAGENRIVLLWKNGVSTTLSDSTQNWTSGRIAVSGNDVYVGGTLNTDLFSSKALYWKNGVPVYLEDDAKTLEISIVNNDLYVLTYSFGETRENKYWKNGGKVMLPQGYAFAMYVVP